jgi:hypothetical protein
MNNIFKTTFLLSLLTILLVAMGGAVGGKGGYGRRLYDGCHYELRLLLVFRQDCSQYV